jgi:hypothetical protein
VDNIKVWLTGLTTVAVAATVFSSPYAANIMSAFFKGVAGSYSAAKH